MTVCHDQLRLDAVATCAVILRVTADEIEDAERPS
jgi:hypothetical protein